MNAEIVVGRIGHDSAEVDIGGAKRYLRGIVTEELNAERRISGGRT